MSLLTVGDKLLLSTFVLEFPNQQLLGAELSQSGVNVALFSSLQLSLLVLADDIVKWLSDKPDRIIAISRHAAQERPLSPVSIPLAELADRLERMVVRRQIAISAWQVVHVNGVPVVNRHQLRAALEAQISLNRPPVLLIDGPAGSGRTHSIHLIRHVATSHQKTFAQLDLGLLSAEDLTIAGVAREIADCCGLPFAEPSYIGVPSEALARRFAERLRRVICHADRCLWLAIDGLAANVPPAVQDLVRALGERTAAGDCPRFKLFLLGAGPSLGLVDPLQQSDSEIIDPFRDNDIIETAKGLNALGAKGLDDAALQHRIDAIVALNTGHDMQAEHAAIYKELIQLRREVEA